MTNGEKLEQIFPNGICPFSKGWLSAEYKEPTTKNDLAVDTIDRVELLRAMDTWDKFGFTTRYGLERLDKDDKGFVPYVKYDDMLKCVTGMTSVAPQSCEDCVSREAVQEVVENTIVKYIPMLIGRFERIPLELAMAIKDLPPVTPKGVTVTEFADRCRECGKQKKNCEESKVQE